MPKPDVKKDGTPIHRCGATINGPKVGRHVVLWRKQWPHHREERGRPLPLPPAVGAMMTRRLILAGALLAAVVLLAARCAEVALVSAP